MRILIVMAMEAEAKPVREALGLSGSGEPLHRAFPARIWRSDYLAVAVNGVDERFDVDSIGTQPAVTTTLHGIEAIEPSLVISAGTAGGFVSRGGAIGSCYVASRCVFHDRRVPLGPFESYGHGDYAVADYSAVAHQLGFEIGTVSTGNALDAPEIDLAHMENNHAVAKDMEAAAVAWVCERFDVTFTALKVITDLVDGDEPTVDEFRRNLRLASRRLADAVPRFVEAVLAES